jgi:hypothetical protein
VKSITSQLLIRCVKLAKSHYHERATNPVTDFEDQIALIPKVTVDSFLYLAPLELYRTQKPYRSRLPYGGNLRRTNIIERGYQVEVRNVRGYEHLFTLESSGFQFVPLPTTISNWTDDNVRSKYLPDLSRWLKEYFRCQEVFIYAYNVCFIAPLPDLSSINVGKLRDNDTERARKGPWKPPIFRAHCGKTKKHS